MKKSGFRYIVILVTLIISVSGFYFSQKKTPVQKKVAVSSTEQITQYLKEKDFNGVALVVKDKKIQLSAGFGYADYQQKIKNTAETSFPIASIQKTITGSLIAEAVAEGKISYDQPIVDFYPELANSSQITIRQLLNQTSGIQMEETDPGEFLETQDSQLNYVLSELTVADQIDFEYTNANYSLLAGILSQVYQLDYAELFSEKISTPLQLDHTYFSQNLSADTSYAKGYPSEASLKNSEVAEESLPDAANLFSSLLGAGNLLMSAENLWQVESTFPNSSELQSLLVSDSNYAGGYWLDNQQLIGLGSIGAYASVLLMDQNRDSGVILLCNQANQNDLGEIANKLWTISQE